MVLFAASGWAQASLPAGEGAPAPLADTAAADAAAKAETPRPLAGDAGAAAGAVDVAPGTVNVDALTDRQRLRRARNLFEYGDCEGVIEVLDDFPLVDSAKDRNELVDAHRMLAVCMFQLGRTAEARRELKSVLYLNPDYELDPFIAPVPLIDMFDGLKLELKQKLDEIKREREKEVTPTIESGQVVVVTRERVVQRTPLVTVLLPFGLAQLANGDLIRAGIFLALQGGALAVSAAGFWTAQFIRDPNGWLGGAPANLNLNDETQVGPHTAAILVNWAGAVAFIALYAAGVGDAWFSWEEQTRLSQQESRTLLRGEAARALIEQAKRAEQAEPSASAADQEPPAAVP